MVAPFELTIRIDGRTATVIRGEFADTERAMLQQFLEQYDQLALSRPLREGFPCHISVSCAKERNIKVEATLPDNDTMGILLHRLRPFILQSEPSSFVKVCSVIGKCIGEPSLRTLLQEQRELYDGRQSRRLMKIASNDKILNSEKVLYDWLNSHEYHRDPDKREAVDKLLGYIPGDLMQGIFVSMLVDKVRAIHNIAALVAVILGECGGQQFEIRDQDTST